MFKYCNFSLFESLLQCKYVTLNFAVIAPAVYVLNVANL